MQKVRGLRDKKSREREGLFVVEGTKVVQELLGAGLTFQAIYGTSAWNGPCTHRVHEEEMARLSHYPTPSPVLALGTIARLPPDFSTWQTGYTLALDGVQDPGNVGTLLRIADWYGIDRVLLSPDCADLFSQKVINASMGSFARVLVHTGELAPWLRAAGLPVLGCDLAGESVHTLSPPAAAIIVIGSEGRGPSPAVRQAVTRWVTIPRFGQAESLNAAIAGAIVCDQLRRPPARIAPS